jgi:hypothetical protein
MAEVCPGVRLKSRNFETEALRRVAEVQLDAIAVAMGCDKSTVSRMFGERGLKLGEVPILLECLGWKIVSRDQVCVDRKIYESFKTIAAAALSRPETLCWDEGQT